MSEELIKWGAWFRDNSDKYLVALSAAGLLLYNLHILHHGSDATQLQFVNGLVNGLTGAFLTLVTGSVMRKATTTTTTATGDDPTKTVSTSTATSREPDLSAETLTTKDSTVK